jgi:hypothetical protein
MKASAHAPAALLWGRERRHLLSMGLGAPKRHYERGCEENTVHVTSTKGESYIAKTDEYLRRDKLGLHDV